MGLLDRFRGPAVPATGAPARDVCAIAQTTPFLEMAITLADDQLEVAGEIHHINGIKQLLYRLGFDITSRGVEAEGIRGVLVPEPWNPHDPNAVAVVIGGQQVGYLSRTDAADYSPALLQLAAQTGRLLPVLARIWARLDGGMVRARVTVLVPNPDPKRRVIRSSEHERMALPESGDRPTPNDHPADGMPRDPATVVLPRGSKIQVTGEEEHHAMLEGWLSNRDEWPVIVTLHDENPARSTSSRVTVRLFGERVGVLTPSTSAQLLPVVRACASAEKPLACNALVKGNQLRIDIVLDVARGSEIPRAWLDQLNTSGAG